MEPVPMLTLMMTPDGQNFGWATAPGTPPLPLQVLAIAVKQLDMQLQAGLAQAQRPAIQPADPALLNQLRRRNGHG